MPKQTSYTTLSGKLREHVHYCRNGKHFTKRASEKSYNFSPGSVAAQQAFGLGSTVGKHLKTVLKPILDPEQPHRTHHCYRICERWSICLLPSTK